MVRLLTRIAAVEYQKAFGMKKLVQPGWSRFTT